MKRLLMALSMVIILLLVGCPAEVEPELKSNLEPSKREVPAAENSPSASVSYEGDQTIPVLSEGFGVYGSKVEFEGVYPGWSGTVPLTIVNGQDKDRLFVVSAISPTKIREGYEALPEQYLYWITISQPSATVLKGTNFQVPITLTMPIDADYAGKKAEVRILIEDTTQTGIVQIAVESKWFIITAE